MNTRGRHLLLDLFGCPAELLNDAELLRELLTRAAEEARAHVVAQVFHPFSPHGVTGVLVIQESHLSVHTWPEEGFVTVDVYVCNYTTDNTAKAERVFRALEAALKPLRKRFQAIHRGGREEDEPRRSAAAG